MRCYGLRKKLDCGILSHFDFARRRWYPWFDAGNITSDLSDAEHIQACDGGQVYDLEISIPPKE